MIISTQKIHSILTCVKRRMENKCNSRMVNRRTIDSVVQNFLHFYLVKRPRTAHCQAIQHQAVNLGMNDVTVHD